MSEPLNLDEIEARAKAATSGPWEAQNYDGAEMDGNWPCLDRVGRPDSAKALAHVALGSDDAEFIAHAREDVPALVQRVREMHGFLENTARAIHSEQEHRAPTVEECRNFHCARITALLRGES